jgi:hypothetical protein
MPLVVELNIYDRRVDRITNSNKGKREIELLEHKIKQNM